MKANFVLVELKKILFRIVSVPKVLTVCAEHIEKHLVEGIYRLSGSASNIQKLR
jgi:hypothetical protein